MFAMAGAEIDRRGRPVAALAPQPGEDFREAPVAALRGQQSQRKDRRSLAAVKLKAAIRPVGQVVGEADRRRVHDRSLSAEHRANKKEESARCCRSSPECRP
jgi:antitoxin (DNA-binding transcriptional repressor) of toxin-antitoxin stability system